MRIVCEKAKMITVMLFLLLSTWSMAMASQLYPVGNMCQLFYHQSAIKNKTLYIYSGLQTFIDTVDEQQTRSITKGYNIYLISVDLSGPWDWHMNISETIIPSSTNPDTRAEPPLVAGGVLYNGPADDSNIYLYGGYTDWWNTSFPGFRGPDSQQYTLWSLDTLSKRWSQYDISPDCPFRPSQGAAVSAPDQHLAFYLNGRINSGSSTSTQDLEDSAAIFLEGMPVIDLGPRTCRNISTSTTSGHQGRTRGALQYIPNFGDSGILLGFGGTEKPVDQLDSIELANFASMDQIDIFDIASYYGNTTSSKAWYKQKATGDVPAKRAEFCAVMISAPDNSSQNIYIYGGRGASEQYFDDVYVLSIPSFVWIRVYGGGSPRYGHTCHIVGRRQLLRVGGLSSSGAGSACDWENEGVAVLDMTTMSWGSVYTPSDEEYEVPENVSNAIRGPTDTTPLNQPPSGFTDMGIARLFRVSVTTNRTTETETPSSTPNGASDGRSNKVLIIAVTVSVLAITAILLLSLCFVFLRRHRRPRPEEFTVGIICALPVEKAALEAILERRYRSKVWGKDDGNDYILGQVGLHQVVLACLPCFNEGTRNAATVATNIIRTFPNTKIGLMVGIGGGRWSSQDDVRLGDVVVSEPKGYHGGVVQWEFCKGMSGIRVISSLEKPPTALLRALESLRAKHVRHGDRLPFHPSFVRSLHCDAHPNPNNAVQSPCPGPSADLLFQPGYLHLSNPSDAACSNCSHCDPSYLVSRPPRSSPDCPRIHYGLVASGTSVVKSGTTRDQIAFPLGPDDPVLCFETAATGLMDKFPCVLIRGIADYCDSHQSDGWHLYAAMVAAAYAKELLGNLPVEKVDGMRPARERLAIGGGGVAAERDHLRKRGHGGTNKQRPRSTSIRGRGG